MSLIRAPNRTARSYKEGRELLIFHSGAMHLPLIRQGWYADRTVRYLKIHRTWRPPIAPAVGSWPYRPLHPRSLADDWALNRYRSHIVGH
jgi:hypothetical protein